MTRDDLQRFRALDIDFESIGLLQDGRTAWDDFAYFCTPTDAEFVGCIGCDGVHFILLPGDERVFCVDPGMGEEGKYVLPVASNFREFMSFVFYSLDANLLSQIWWMSESVWLKAMSENYDAYWALADSPTTQGDFQRKYAALLAIAKEFGLISSKNPLGLPTAIPFYKIKTLQTAFDPSKLNWSGEYYDVLGLERP